MSNLSKAKDFYLRGFKSQYIKRRTGISTQSLLKTLLAKGEKYTQEDIFDYQLNYVRKHYTKDQIIRAYKDVSSKYPNAEAAYHAREIITLGCCFGRLPKLVRIVIGDDEFNNLKNSLWQSKIKKTVRERYGVDNVFEKQVFDKFVSKDAITDGRIKREATLLERYGVTSPNADPEICKRMQATAKETNHLKYGVDNPMKVPEIAAKSAKNRQRIMIEKYGAGNSVQVKSIRDSIFESRRRNNTLNSSIPEEMLHLLLINKFGEDDVVRNKIIDSRYPYHVDFYIKSRDLFIELNGDRCHNTHWFDKDCERDVQILKAWQENADRLEAKNGKPSRYEKYIKTWSVTDVAKRESARNANLNYLVFWDGSSRRVNKRCEPNLIDAYAWFAAGCPDAKNWYKENTY